MTVTALWTGSGSLFARLLKNKDRLAIDQAVTSNKQMSLGGGLRFLRGPFTIQGEFR